MKAVKGSELSNPCNKLQHKLPFREYHLLLLQGTPSSKLNPACRLNAGSNIPPTMNIHCGRLISLVGSQAKYFPFELVENKSKRNKDRLPANEHIAVKEADMPKKPSPLGSVGRGEE